MGDAVRNRHIRRIARRHRTLVNDLELPRPFDARELCRLVARQRPRPIELCPIELSAAGPCGLWLQTRQADYIVFDSHTSRVHQDHIILHELGHVLCHQDNPGALAADGLRSLFPALAPELVKQALGRTRYSAVEEQEAEIFVHLVLERARLLASLVPGAESRDPAADRVLRGFVAGTAGDQGG